MFDSHTDHNIFFSIANNYDYNHEIRIKPTLNVTIGILFFNTRKFQNVNPAMKTFG